MKTTRHGDRTRDANAPRGLTTLLAFSAGALALAGGCDDGGPGGVQGDDTGSGGGGTYGDVSTSVGPTAETGAGAGTSQSCVPGATQSCFDGPPERADIGICRSGLSTCSADGTFWESCVGQVLPSVGDCSTPDLDEACTGSPGPCTDPPLFAAIFGGDGEDLGLAVASDAEGNTYVSGLTDGGDLGAGTVGPGMFVLKLDPSGAIVWQLAPGNGLVRAMAVDTQGDLVLFGVFDQQIDFGGGPLTSSAETLFLAKVDADGEEVFSRTFEGRVAGDYLDWAVATTPLDEIVVAGAFEETLDLGGAPLTSQGGDDVFLAKLDAAGEHLWSEALGGEGPQAATGVAVDADGRIALSGYFEVAIELGDESWEVESGSDGFIAVLDPDGTPLWSRVAASDSAQRIVDVAFDPGGDVVIVGVTLSALDLGGGPIDPPPAPFQCFGARLAGGAGAHVWSLGFGCHLNEYVPLGARIAVDGSGRTSILATVNGPTDVGGTPVTSHDGDVLLFAVSPSGASEWVRTYDSTDHDQGFELAADPDGNLVFTGHVGGPTDFGGGLVPSTSLSVQAFLVKVAP